MPRKVSLSIELLETFVTLIEHGGEAAAAGEALDIQQASMSKRLRFLQHAGPVLGHPWVVRDGRRWKLTEEGEKALPAVQQLLARYNQLRSFIDQERPDLAFASGRHAVLGFVRLALGKFRERHENARLRVSTLRGTARIEGVANGSLDLATVAENDETIHQIARRKLHVETIATNRLALVCAAGTPWAKELRKSSKTGSKISQLKDFPLILPEPDAGVRQQLDSVFLTHKLVGKLDIHLEIGGWGTILDYVRDGHGVGIVSESALRTVPTRRELVAAYFSPKAIPVINTKIICRYKVDTDELDLNELAQEFYALLKNAAGTQSK